MRTTTAQKATRRASKNRVSPSSPAAAERYTPRRLAQFLLENAVDSADYAAARREVRKLGFDPDTVPHEPPSRT
jgi:hypothetical protein